MKKIILYTAGSHGSFLRFLFDCYDSHSILPLAENTAGNWHLATHHASTDTNNLCFDMAHQGMSDEYSGIDYQHQRFNIVFESLEEFFYVGSCYVDRGGDLIDHSGIELLEKNPAYYDKKYKAGADYVKRLKELYGINPKRISRSTLRNYFILTFMTYFNHTCWKANNKLKKQDGIFVKLEDILDYKKLKTQLDGIFDFKLDFESLHSNLLNNNNRPYAQILKVREIISAVKNNQNIDIEGLNTISEAFVCFYFEKKHYDINFNLSDSFFKTTRELRSYIDHFPPYMKKPNNLFVEHWRIYNDKH